MPSRRVVNRRFARLGMFRCERQVCSQEAEQCAVAQVPSARLYGSTQRQRSPSLHEDSESRSAQVVVVGFAALPPGSGI